MRSKNSLLLALFLIAVVLFVYGGVRLFQLRFESGEVYPQYSTLRSDPLGTRVLYQSLERVTDLDVSRNTLPLSRLPLENRCTLVIAGLKYDNGLLTSSGWLPSVEHLVGSGSRVVICFYPQETGGSPPENPKGEDNKEGMAEKPDQAQAKKSVEKETKDGKDKKPAEEDLLRLHQSLLARRWGFEFDFEPAPKAQWKTQQLKALLHADGDLPKELSWHGQLAFKNLKREWRVLYHRRDRPVLMERSMGNGRLVLAADCYFLSNEALWKDRQAQLLTWLLGPHRRIVFDETHLGVEEAPAVMSLIRKYRLHGLLASLVLLAALLVWRNRLSLVPGLSPTDIESTSTGLDSSGGFTNLLRRSIPADRLLEVSFQQWEKSSSAGLDSARYERVQALLAEEQARPAKRRDTVASYKSICREVARKTEPKRN